LAQGTILNLEIMQEFDISVEAHNPTVIDSNPIRATNPT